VKSLFIKKQGLKNWCRAHFFGILRVNVWETEVLARIAYTALNCILLTYDIRLKLHDRNLWSSGQGHTIMKSQLWENTSSRPCAPQHISDLSDGRSIIWITDFNRHVHAQLSLYWQFHIV
jgi:hypothetical protein